VQNNVSPGFTLHVFNMATQTKLPVVPDKALEALRSGIQSVLDSKDWTGFLSAIKQIHDYSFNNRLLIMLGQVKRGWSPSSFVAGQKKWDFKFQRKLKDGEFVKGIWILAPVLINKKDENGNQITNDRGEPVKIPIRFRGVRVWDHRQTEGEPLPDVPNKETMMAQLNGDAPQQLLNSLQQVALSRSVKVALEVSSADMGGALGRCWFQNGGRANKIELVEGLNRPTAISVLAHELGHALLHNRDEYQEHDSSSIKELEAESVAYLVCDHYGIDLGSRSFCYIVSHNTATDDIVAELLKSGERILRAYEEIITFVDQQLEEPAQLVAA